MAARTSILSTPMPQWAINARRSTPATLSAVQFGSAEMTASQSTSSAATMSAPMSGRKFHSSPESGREYFGYGFLDPAADVLAWCEFMCNSDAGTGS